jgi:hypothetical protein
MPSAESAAGRARIRPAQAQEPPAAKNSQAEIDTMPTSPVQQSTSPNRPGAQITNPVDATLPHIPNRDFSQPQDPGIPQKVEIRVGKDA